MSKQTHGLLAIKKSKNVVGNEVGKSKDSFVHAFLDLDNYDADRIEAQSVNIAMSKANMAALYEAMPKLDIIISTSNISTKNYKSVDTTEYCIRKISANAFAESVNRNI